MTATLIGLVYGTASLTARRIIIPDDIDGDAYLDRVEANLPAGMAMVRIARAALPQVKGSPVTELDTLLPAIAAQGGPVIGKQPLCALVDANGRVIDVLITDPALYQAPVAVTPWIADNLAPRQAFDPITPAPPFTIVPHPQAAIGATIIKGVLTPQPVDPAKIAVATP